LEDADGGIPLLLQILRRRGCRHEGFRDRDRLRVDKTGMSGSAIPAIRIVPNDNVATLLEAAAAGAQIDVQCPSDPAGRARLRAAEAIPAGHKIALADIPNGAAIRKYGTAIGYACTTITAGSLVHVLNTRSSLSPAQRSEA